jgi:hypothetical protein
LPRRETFIQQVRGQNHPVLVLDGGDSFFSSPTKKPPTKPEELHEIRKGRTILNAMNMMGYEAMGIGPADLQLGLPVLQDFEKEAKFPFLCANIVDKATKKPIFKPYVVIRAGGVNFGVYSVVMLLTNETYANRVLQGAEVLDPEKVTAELVPELKRKCDVVIALSHLNVDSNEKILKANPGIDVLIDPLARTGTKNIWVADNEYLEIIQGTPLLRIDGQGSRVGVFEMYFKGSPKLADYLFVDGALEPHIMRHPDMTKLVQEFERGRVQPYPVSFDVNKPHLYDEFLGQEGCGGCHADQLAFWNSTQHSRTYATLEKTKDELRGDCIICHTLGYGVGFADPKTVGKFKEVQCESCHGVKPDHAVNPKAFPMGAVNEESCWGCHNPQITEKEFKYAEALPKASCPKMQK